MAKKKSLSCVDQEVAIDITESQSETGDEEIMISIVLCATYVLSKSTQAAGEEEALFGLRATEIY